MIMLNDAAKSIVDELSLVEIYIKDESDNSGSWRAKVYYTLKGYPSEKHGWYRTRSLAQSDLDQIINILQVRQLDAAPV